MVAASLFFYEPPDVSDTGFMDHRDFIARMAAPGRIFSADSTEPGSVGYGSFQSRQHDTLFRFKP